MVFQNGVIMGGDAGYYYLGTYTLNERSFNATIKASAFIDGYESVFKTVGRELTLTLVGTFTDDTHAIGQGQLMGSPGFRLGIKLMKRS